MKNNLKTFIKKHMRHISGIALSAAVMAMLSAPMISYADIIDVYWDGNKACWEEDEDSESERYQVALYRGSNLVKTVKTTNMTYNFVDDMSQTGNYKFRVRAYEDGEYAAWSSYSSSKYKQGTSSSSSSSSKNSSSVTTLPNVTYNPYREGWFIKNNRWHYMYADGTEVQNAFAFIDGAWYNFESDGAMRTGWFQRDNSWFYLESDGKMVLGWHAIGDKWYYFDQSNGIMLSNAATPDGYWVGADGARVD